MDALATMERKSRLQMLAVFGRRAWNRVAGMNRLFLFVVVIPVTLSVLYFGFVAHDIYVSESEFVVRTPQHQSMGGGLGALFQGATSGIQGSDDIYSVQEFIASRDALQKLDNRFHFKKIFGDRSIDRWHRFPLIYADDSFEGLLRYYRDRVIKTDIDSTSQILTLTVRGFSAAEAYQVSDALLEMSEDLVNQLNERARKDLVQFAELDVDRAEAAAKAAVLAVSSYRNSRSVFDPEKQSGLQLAQVGRLQEELLATEQQIADLGKVAENNPQLPVLQNRVKVLEASIAAETAKVAGGEHSLSSKSADYEGFVLERDFAGKRLELALAALQQARDNAMKQQLYLERIAEPNRPDTAIEPRRVLDVIATLLICLLTWGILSLLVTAVKEHAE